MLSRNLQLPQTSMLGGGVLQKYHLPWFYGSQESEILEQVYNFSWWQLLHMLPLLKPFPISTVLQ